MRSLAFAISKIRLHFHPGLIEGSRPGKRIKKRNKTSSAAASIKLFRWLANNGWGRVTGPSATLAWKRARAKPGGAIWLRQDGTLARIYNEGTKKEEEKKEEKKSEKTNGWLSDRFKNNLAGMTRNRRRRGKNKP